MFTEREAIKLRMEQIHERQLKLLDAPFRIEQIHDMQHKLDNEMEHLFQMLKDLDAEDKQEATTINPIVEQAISPEVDETQTTEKTAVENTGVQEEVSKDEVGLETSTESPAAEPDNTEVEKDNEENTITSIVGVKNNNVASADAKEGLTTEEKVDVVLDIVKGASTPISGRDIKDEFARRTGEEISNITQFMNTVMKYEPDVEKPFRGAYHFTGDASRQETKRNQRAQQNVH